MKRRLKENLEIGDRVFAPRDEYKGTVIDINRDRVLVDGPFGEEYHNINDLEKLGNYDTPDFFSKHVTESKRKKIIRLTESDLTRIVKRVISENEHHEYAKMNDFEFMNEIDSLYNDVLMIEDANCGKINDMEDKWNLLDRAHNSHGVDRSEEFVLCGAKIRRFKKNRCTPRENEPRSMRLRGDSDKDRWSQYR